MASDLEVAFTAGTVLQGQQGQIRIEVVPLGEVTLPTGQIVACDPTSRQAPPWFERTIAPGRYPVDLSVAELEPAARRVAAARIRVGDRPVARWQMATRPGQDLATLRSGYLYGHPVDSGMSCFVDQATAPALLAEPGQALLHAAMPAGTRWAALALGDDRIAVFSSGHGDGFFGSYWGLDASGAAVALVTDFSILSAHDVQVVVLEGVLGAPLGPIEHAELAGLGVVVSRYGNGVQIDHQVTSVRPSLEGPDGEPLPFTCYPADDSVWIDEPARTPAGTRLRLEIRLRARPLPVVR